MKKESSAKKSKLGLIIAIALIALLAIAGVVLALTLGGGSGDANEPEKLESKIYWNIDRKTMLSVETGLSTREAAADGMWYIRFAVDGEQVELPCADRKLVNQIDMKDLMCLKFDADGIIIDVVDPEEVYTKIQDKVFVQTVNGANITTNTSLALNGMQQNLTLPEGVKIWNVSDRIAGTVIGSATELEALDQVIIFGSDENTPTEVFMVDRYWESKIYWRVSTQMYDTTKKMSSRKVSDDGYWYIDFTAEGETKTYRTDSQEVINALDGYGVNDACCGMVFNEQGDVIDCFNAGIAARGAKVAISYDITSLSDDGKTFTATRVLFGTEIGKTFTGTITEETDIFNINETSKVVGERTELKMNDRVLVIQSADGSIHTIFIINRMVPGPLYYNIEQKWSTALGHTRVPDENGWYVFNLAADGKIKTVKTKDKDLAAKMDAFSLKIFGLKLKGDVVVDVYAAVNVAGNYSFAGNNFVTSTEGGVLGTVSTTGTAANGVMSADCKVFDVSNCYKKFKGEKTTVRVGDQVMCYQNAQGEVTHIWVLNRYMKGTTIYWNMNRYYANGETAREPDADGYYVFNAIKLGTTKVVQLKTKDKEIASRFDKENSTTAAALKVSNGIIKAAYPAPSAIGGYYRLPGFWILGQEDETTKTWQAIAATGAIGNLNLADDCKIYNFSNLAKEKGEKTTLKKNDRVWPIAGTDGKVQIIFVIERDVAGSKLAFPKAGCSAPDENGNYTYELLVGGKVGTYTTKDADIATFINGKLSQGCAVTLKGKTITGAYYAQCAADVRGAAISYYDFVSIKDGKINTQRNKVGASDVGATSSLAISDSYKAYMVDRSSSVAWGSKVKLTKGDRLYAYYDNNGEVSLIFVAYDCTLSSNMRKCAHCGKTVHWESIAAGYGPQAGYTPEVAHYYVPSNMKTNGTYTFGSAVHATDEVYPEIVLDLNGKTIDRYTTTGNISGPVVQSTEGTHLIITDYSSAKSGKIVAQAGAVGTGASTLLHVQSGAKMSINGGVFDASKTSSAYTSANGGTVSVGGELIVNGGTIYGRASSGNGSAIGGWGATSITINGGTIIGNTVTTSIPGTGLGGTICTNGDLTINGGTIKGGTAAAGGDNIYFGRDAKLTITGGTIDGGVQVANAKATVTLSGKPVIKEGANYGLNPGSAKVDATGLKKGAEVYVDAFGIFTTEFASEDAAQAALDNGMLKNGGETTMLARNGKAIESKDDGLVHLWTNATKLPTSGNWKLDTDVTVASGVTLGGDLYIDLNNHTIVNTGATPVVFTTGTNKLTVDDTSATKGGVIKATTTAAGNYNAGLIYVGADGQYVQHAGTLDGSNLTTTYTSANAGTLTISNGKIGGVAKYGSAIINGGTIKGWTTSGNGGAIGMMNLTSLTVNGGDIIGGTVTKSINGTGFGGAIMTGGHLTITGGTISGGSASENGDNIFLNNASANVSISGGTIDGGVVLNNFGSATITGNATIGKGSQYGLKLGAGKTVNMAGLTGEVYVDVFGVFSTAFTDAAAAQALIDNENVKLGKTQATDAEIKVDGTSLKVATASTIDPSVFNEWNAANAAEVLGGNASDNLHKTNLPTSGKWKLIDAVTINASTEMTGDLTLDLNGQTVTMTGASYAIGTAGNKLTIDDTSSAKQGTIKTTATAINARAAVIYVSALVDKPGTFVLKNGILDGSSAVNSQGSLVSGTVTVGNATNTFSTFTMDGGVIKGQKSSVGTSGVGGSCIGLMNSTHFVMNGGELIARTSTADTDYVSATGSCINAGGASGSNPTSTITINGGTLRGSRTMNHGGVIYTAGNLYINGGTLYGAKTQNSGAVCANGGAETKILGGTIYGGQTVNNPGNGSAVDKAGGVLTIGGDAIIGGGVNIRSSAKLVLKESPVVDCTLGAEQKFNIRINGGSIYLNDTTGTAIQTVNGTYSLKYKCNTVVGVVAGNDTVIEHNIVGGVCTDCGYTDGAWTNTTALPTTGKHTLDADVTLTAATVLTGDMTLDLNGHTVTRQIASTETADMFAINTNGFKLTINDTSGKFGDALGKIVATTAADFKVTSKAGLIYAPTGSVTVNNGIIDGSNLVHKAAGFAGVITTDTGKITINGGEIKGMRNLGTASASSGATSSSNAGNTLAATAAGAKITVNGGKLVAPVSTAGTDYVSGAGGCIISKAPVTITGGELIGSRVANHGGVVFVDGNSLTMTGGVLKNGISTHSGLVNCGGVSSITGGVLIGGNATSNSGHGGENIDFCGTQLTIGGDAIIGGGIGIRGSAQLILTGKPIINDGMQAQARGDIRIKAGQTNAKVYLNEISGTPILSGASTEVLKDVEYNTDGTIKGLKAVEAAQTWTTGNALPTSGTWKLGADIKLTADDTSTAVPNVENCIVSTGDLVIDLNGHTIERAYAYSQDGYKYALEANHTVIITDTSAAGNGTIKTTSSVSYTESNASVVYAKAGRLILAGGTIDGSAISNPYATAMNGAVTMGSNVKFTMIDGEIKGQRTTAAATGKGGGCVGGWGGSLFTMYGGKLTANTADADFVNYQGTCVATSGDVVIHGGELVGGKGYSHGGTIYTTGNFTMTGGYIHGGSSNNSGNILASGAKVTITGGVILDGKFNKAESDIPAVLGGSNVDIAGTNAVAVIGGNAVIGGGVSTRNAGAKLTIQDYAVINKDLQTQKCFDLRTKAAANANCGLYLGTTRIGGTAGGFYKLTRALGGEINDIVAGN